MLNINNKPFDELSDKDIQILLEQFDTDENFYFEFKNDDVSTNGLAKEVCAFSNTFGGYIFLGIEDDKSITGCKNWSEEKINNVMFYNITPTPSFECRRIICDEKCIFIIRVDEGLQPPYITNKGQIYERVSSSSVPIKDSYKLTDLYNRREKETEKLHFKIGIEELNASNGAPDNLAGYIDEGFSLTSRSIKRLSERFEKADLEQIASYIKSGGNPCSISQIGQSYYISIGQASAPHVPSGFSNFIEIMPDGSMKFRILIFFDDNKSDYANIGAVTLCENTFNEIYDMIFGEIIQEEFLYALKYQKLTVLKQFSPKVTANFDEETKEIFDKLFFTHNKKYGNNVMITSDRLPKTGYFKIDEEFAENIKEKLPSYSLTKLLFSSSYYLMGFIDDFE